MEPRLFYLTAPQLRKLLSVVSDGCSHSVLCCTLPYLHLKLGRNLCVGHLFLQKLWSALRFQAHLSLPRLLMQWRTTVLPLIEGQEGLVAWLACPRYEKSHDLLMKTLHEPVTVCKNFEGENFRGYNFRGSSEIRENFTPRKFVAIRYRVSYRIAGYFRGVPIFVIFVVNRRVTKFSTHEFYDLLHVLYKVEQTRR